METIADALPKEMARAREILGYYKEAGAGAGAAVGAAMIERSLRAADEAVISGDLIAMIRSLKELQEIK